MLRDRTHNLINQYDNDRQQESCEYWSAFIVYLMNECVTMQIYSRLRRGCLERQQCHFEFNSREHWRDVISSARTGHQACQFVLNTLQFGNVLGGNRGAEDLSDSTLCLFSLTKTYLLI